MSKYWYPQEAVNSKKELENLVAKGRIEPFSIWLVRPKTSNLDGYINPMPLKLNEDTRFTQRENEYTIGNEDCFWSFWSPGGEACFPYGLSADTDPAVIGYIFTKYWLAVGYAIRTGVLQLEAHGDR